MREMGVIWLADEIRNDLYRSMRGRNGGIGHTTAKAYADRHGEVEMFLIVDEQISLVMAT